MTGLLMMVLGGLLFLAGCSGGSNGVVATGGAGGVEAGTMPAPGAAEGGLRVEDTADVLTAVAATGFYPAGHVHFATPGRGADIATGLSVTGTGAQALLSMALGLAGDRSKGLHHVPPFTLPATGSLVFTERPARGGIDRYSVAGDLSVPLRAGGAHAMQIEGWGAWGEHHHFLVYTGTPGTGDPYSFGILAGRSSTGTPAGTGTGTWRGSMAGRSATGFVAGGAEVVYDFATDFLDVELSGIATVDGATSYPDIEWTGLYIDDPANSIFNGAGIEGRFYGPGHEEVGATFEKDGITGAFGAKRVP